MNYCKNCGSKIDSAKFCSNCGEKNKNPSKNKIDKSVDYLKYNVDNVSKEIKESVVLNDFKSKTLPKITNKIIDVLAIIGLIIILSQIFIVIVNNENFYFQDAYFRYENSTFKHFFSGFIAEIIPSTILPLFFMIISGFRKKWMLITTLILLFLIFIISRNKTVNQLGNTNAETAIDSVASSPDTLNEVETTPNSKVDINKILDNLKPDLIGNENIRIVNNSINNISIDFSFIKNYKNQYAFNDICQNEKLNQELKNKFGNDLFEMYINYINVQPPIRIENEETFLTACLAHSCGYNESVLYVDFTNDTFYAAILDDGHIYITSNVENFSENDLPLLPKKLLNWINLNLKK